MTTLYPLNVNQNALYHFQKLYPKDASYRSSFLYRINGKLDVDRLKKVLNAACNAISVFGIEFVELENAIYHRRVNNTHDCTVLVKKNEESLENFRNNVIKIAQDIESGEVNLNQWPLVQFKLFTTNELEHYLLFTCMHILGDAVSYHLLINCINQSYNENLTDKDLQEYARNFFLKSYFTLNKKSDFDYKAHNYFIKEIANHDSFLLKKIVQRRNHDNQLEGNIDWFYLEKLKIKEFLEKQAYKENTFFLAIYALLLNKLTDENRIVIGFPLINRRKEERNVFGYFVNTLPLIVDFTAVRKFPELIKQINGKVFNLLRYQDYDLNNLDDTNHQFNNYFTFYKRAFNYHLQHCTVERIVTKRNHLLAEFRCTVENLDTSYRINFETGKYFNNVNIKNIFDHIVTQLIQQHDKPLQDITVLSESEQSRYYRQINNVILQYEEKSIKVKFEEIVRLYPENIALHDGKSSLTYDQVNRRANQIARYLLTKASASKYIIISANRDNNLIIFLLAILKMGKCYVPIDPEAPEERIKYILNNIGNCFAVGDNQLLKHCDKYSSFTEILDEADFFSNSNLDLLINKHDPAYMIYTSGSTGNPKGVMVSHANLLSLMNACQCKFDFHADDVWTLFHSFSFDFSVWEIFGCLLTGGKLIVADQHTIKSAHNFYHLLVEQKVTVLNQTPTAFKLLMQQDSHIKKQLYLKYVIFGGESLSFPMLKPWITRHALGKVKLINMYGITETTVHVSYYEIKSEDIQDNKSIIGKPLNHLGVYIINGHGNIMPPTIPGELLVFGEGVSLGYYKNPALSKSRFMRDKQTDMRYYKSGDLGKINTNGSIEYLGRMDKQIKLRGFRIEPGEIESQILKTSMVEDCVVDVSIHEQARLIAYIVPKQNVYDELKLRATLKTFLLPHMIPAQFIKITRIPINLNGKTDITNLRNMLDNAQPVAKGKTATERFLFELIASSIKHWDFDLMDNLFDIGITSINVIEIFSCIKQKYILENFTLLDIFQYYTLEKLATYIDKKVVVNHLDNQFENVAVSANDKNIFPDFEQIEMNENSFNYSNFQEIK